MKLFAVMVALLCALMLLTGSILADTYIQSTNETDAFQMGGQTQPARVDTLEMWISPQQAAFTVSSGMKMIIDVEEGKFYYLRPDTKSYYEFPADLLGTVIDSLSQGDQAMADSVRGILEQMMGEITYSVEETDSTQTIGDWNTKLYRVTAAMPMGMEVKSEIWAATEVDMDWDMYHALTMQVLTVLPGAEKIYEEISKIQGLTVKSTTTTTMMGSPVVSRQQLLQYEADMAAPAGMYEIPGDYTQSDNPLMMMGQ